MIVTGNTFEHKEFLKSLNGEWDADRRCWIVDDRHEANVKSKVGLIATKEAMPTPQQSGKSGTDWIRRILGIDDDDDTPATGSGVTSFNGDDRTYLNYFADQNPTSFFGFSSLSAMVRYVEALPPEIAADHRYSRNAGWKPGRSWSGSDNMADALSLARNGWHRGVKQAGEVAEHLRGVHAVQRRRQHSIAGGHVNKPMDATAKNEIRAKNRADRTAIKDAGFSPSQMGYVSKTAARLAATPIERMTGVEMMIFSHDYM